MHSRIKILKEKLNEQKVFKSLSKYNYHPRTLDELKEIQIIKGTNEDPDLNDIDVSNLTEVKIFSDWGNKALDFFSKNNFYVDEWNVSRVKDFTACFYNCSKFNSDVSKWDTSNGVEMRSMFLNCISFNNYVNNFDVSNAKTLFSFFNYCKNFNQEVYNFKPQNSISHMFRVCEKFNQDISMWDVSNVKYMEYAFEYTESFKQDLNKWDVSNVVDWRRIFDGSLMEKYPELIPFKFRRKYAMKIRRG